VVIYLYVLPRTGPGPWVPSLIYSLGFGNMVYLLLGRDPLCWIGVLFYFIYFIY